MSTSPLLSESSTGCLCVTVFSKSCFLSFIVPSTKTSTLYLSELTPPDVPSRSLRSASEPFLAVPEPKDCNTKRHGQRAFRYVAPSQWNALTRSIKETDPIHSFRSTFEMHFFHSLLFSFPLVITLSLSLSLSLSVCLCLIHCASYVVQM